MYVHYVYFFLLVTLILKKQEEIKINYKELYNLHIQLLNVYEKNKYCSNLQIIFLFQAQLSLHL